MLRASLTRYFQPFVPSTQHLSEGLGTEQAVHAVRSFVDLMCHSSAVGAVLFIDVKAAFDS
eukprot:3449996-Alexandrium_andersonii.AAC.1